jgi:hypothetical protein
MAETLSAALEAGECAPLGAWHEALFASKIHELWTRSDHLEHLLGIGLPIGRQLQSTAIG